MKLSLEGEKYLQDLRIYLFTKGVKEDDLVDFIEEANRHLLEGEQDGKNVQQIFGCSPKDYANDLIEAMGSSLRRQIAIVSQIVLIMISFNVSSMGLTETLHFTLIELIGYPLVYIGFLLCIGYGVRFSSFKSQKHQTIILFISIAVGMLAMLAIFLLNIRIGEPFIVLSIAGSIAVTGAFSSIFLILIQRLLGWGGFLGAIAILLFHFL